MLQPLIGDIHVHTFLSPCASRDMSPDAVVARCIDLGIDIVAIADHNSSANVGRAMEIARGRDICVIPAMEVTTAEDVHVLALFPDLDSIETFDRIVSQTLPAMDNDPKIFGHQWIAEPSTGRIAEDGRLLAASVSMSFDETVMMIHNMGGTCVPAHVDRPSFGVLAQLGFVPPGLPVAAVEVSSYRSEAEMRKAHPGLFMYTLVCSSDAHEVQDIGRGCSLFVVERPCYEELVMALRGHNGRHVLIE